MDLKEIKKITAYAKKAGIRSLKVNGFELEFHDATILDRPTKKAIPASDLSPLPKSPPPPSLEEINAYIYSETPDA